MQAHWPTVKRVQRGMVKFFGLELEEGGGWIWSWALSIIAVPASVHWKHVQVNLATQPIDLSLVVNLGLPFALGGANLDKYARTLWQSGHFVDVFPASHRPGPEIENQILRVVAIRTQNRKDTCDYVKGLGLNALFSP